MKVLIVGLLTMVHFFGISQSIESTICAPMKVPTITAPSTNATITSDTFSVSGVASSNVTVNLLLDGTSALLLTSDDGGLYSGEVMVSSSGKHTLAVTATNVCTKNSGDSVQVTVSPVSTSTASGSGAASTTSGNKGTSTTATSSNQDSKDLTIQLSAVSDGASTTASSIYIAGTLSDSGVVAIYSGSTLLAQTNTASLTFGLRVPLSIGTNSLRITAQSGSKTTDRTLTVIRRRLGMSGGKQTTQAVNGSMASPAKTDTNNTWFYMGKWSLAAATTTGGFVFVAALLVWWFVMRRRRKARTPPPEEITPSSMGGGTV